MDEERGKPLLSSQLIGLNIVIPLPWCGPCLLGPSPLNLLATALIICVSQVIFLLYMAPSVIHIYTSIVLSSLVLLMLILTGCIEPGILPRQSSEVLQSMIIGEGDRVCSTCFIIKPKR